MEGGIEVHVKDDRGVVEVVHEPQHFYDNPRRMKLACGVAIDDWKWEIIVPKGDSSPVLKRVDPMQEHHAYLATQSRWMENIDIRVYGVDTDRWQEAAEA